MPIKKISPPEIETKLPSPPEPKKKPEWWEEEIPEWKEEELPFVFPKLEEEQVLPPLTREEELGKKAKEARDNLEAEFATALKQFPRDPRTDPWITRAGYAKWEKIEEEYQEIAASIDIREKKALDVLAKQDEIQKATQAGDMPKAKELVDAFLATYSEDPDFTESDIEEIRKQQRMLTDYPFGLIDELPDVPTKELFPDVPELPKSWNEVLGIDPKVNWREYVKERPWLITGQFTQPELNRAVELLVEHGVPRERALALVGGEWEYGEYEKHMKYSARWIAGHYGSGLSKEAIIEAFIRHMIDLEKSKPDWKMVNKETPLWVAATPDLERNFTVNKVIDQRFLAFGWKRMSLWQKMFKTGYVIMSAVPVMILGGVREKGWEEAHAKYEEKPMWLKVVVEVANPIWYLPFGWAAGVGWRGAMAAASKIPYAGRYLAPAMFKTGWAVGETTRLWGIPGRVWGKLTGKEADAIVKQMAKEGAGGLVPKEGFKPTEAMTFAQRLGGHKVMVAEGDAVMDATFKLQGTWYGRAVWKLPAWTHKPLGYIDPRLTLKKLPERAWKGEDLKALTDSAKYLTTFYRQFVGPMGRQILAGVYKITAGTILRKPSLKNTVYKYFGANPKIGNATKLVKPKPEYPDASLHISDILENPARYVFETAQAAELVENLNAVKLFIFRFLEENGITLTFRDAEGKLVKVTAETLERYFPRMVWEKELLTGEVIERAFLIPHPERRRVFEFAETGVITGHHYLDPAETLDILWRWANMQVANDKILKYTTSHIGRSLDRTVKVRYPDLAARREAIEGLVDGYTYLHKTLVGIDRGVINVGKLPSATLRKIDSIDPDIGVQLRIARGTPSAEARLASGKRLDLADTEFVALNRGFNISKIAKVYQVIDAEGKIAFKGTTLKSVGEWLTLKPLTRPMPKTFEEASSELVDLLFKRMELGQALPKGIVGKTEREIEQSLAKLAFVDVEKVYLDATGKLLRLAPGIIDKAQIKALKERVTDSLRKITPELKDIRRDYRKAIDNLRYPSFTQGVVNWGPFRGRYLPIQFAEPMKAKLKDQASRWMGYTSTIAATARMLVAGLDLSWGFIQGLLMLTQNPEIWGRSFYRSILAAGDERVYWRLIEQHWDTATVFTRSGGYLGSFEYYEAFSAVEGFLARRFPERIAALPRGFMNQTYGRFNAAWGTMGDAARLYGFEAMSPHIRAKYGEAGDRWLAEHLNLMTGVISFEGLGLGGNKAAFLNSWVFFAPRYTYSGFALIGNCLRGGVKGQLARESLAKFMMMGSLYYVGVARVLGYTEEEIIDGLTPTSPRFLAVRIGGAYVGIGSIWYGMARLAGDIAQTIADDEWVNFVKLDRWDNPLIKFWFTRTSQLTSAILLGTGLPPVHETPQDYLGEPLQSVGDWVKFISGYGVPICLQTLYEGEQISAGRTTAEFFGLRTYPAPFWKVREELRETYSVREYGRTWINLMPSEQDELEKKYTDLGTITEKAKETSKRWADLPWDRWEAERKRYKEAYIEKVKVASNAFISCRRANPTGGDCGRNFRTELKFIGREYAALVGDLEERPEYKGIYEFFDQQ